MDSQPGLPSRPVRVRRVGHAKRPLRVRLPFAAVALSAALLAAACAPAATIVPIDPSPAAGFRVVATATGEQVTLERASETLSRADVVFFGEQHDDPETHRAEALLLAQIGRSGRPVVLSLEMFERDVQSALDAYLAGGITEDELLATTRPWPRYATDYRPLVEIARARGWPVLASNVPRALASAIGRQGRSVLDTLASPRRRHAARDIACPDDAYRTRFMEQMRSHTPGAAATAQPGDTLPTAVAERFYQSQCVKDETMAESIVEARRRAGTNAIVIHFNGAFHSDFGQGTVDRVRRREPGWSTAIISAIPSRDPSSAPIAPHLRRADYIIFTRTP